MSKVLRIGTIERRLASGEWETIRFDAGVNLLVGAPGTGKTKWLQTLDYLLGDSGEMPFESDEDSGLGTKYEAAAAQVFLDGREVRVERRWREAGAKTKVFVEGEAKSTKEFQGYLLDELDIPRLNYPKGNPASGQTWPELSFRSLLRHVYRQQRFWGDLVDQQPDTEALACVLQFLGLAEHVFTPEYGELVQKQQQVERLRARRDQYGETLDELAREILGEGQLTVSASPLSVADAVQRLKQRAEGIKQSRAQLISQAADSTLPAGHRHDVEALGERRATILAELEQSTRRHIGVLERMTDIRRYEADLASELERIDRAETAGAVLGDLRITHCPACDRPIHDTTPKADRCFLCHQADDNEFVDRDMGMTRIRFERDRIAAELKEASDLVTVLVRDSEREEQAIRLLKEDLGTVDRAIAPTREIVAPLVQEDVSALDMKLGELSERQRQLVRVSAAVELGEQIGNEIVALERAIQPLRDQVHETRRSADFGSAASMLEDGMNAYLNALNVYRPSVWQHSDVQVDLSDKSMTLRIGSRRWRSALGGTDTLYFLMSYHYGLLTLTAKSGCHYPGLSIIDVPGELAGEKIGDRENFIVQPFIDLLSKSEYEGAQLIVTGATFEGLEGAKRVSMRHRYVAS